MAGITRAEVECLRIENERLRGALLAIKLMDAYQAPDDPIPAHEIMRQIAESILETCRAHESERLHD